MKQKSNISAVMMNRFYGLVLAIVYVALPLCLFSQTDGEESSISEEIPVVSDWIPPLNDAFKIDENPRIVDTIMPAPDYDYPMIPKVLTFDFEPDLIKPAKMRILEPLDKLYKGYVRGGIGTQTMPLGELYLTNLRSRDKAMGVHIRHFSSQGDGRAPAFNGFSQNSAKLWYKHFMRYHTAETTVNYRRDGIHHFGFAQEDVDVERAAIRKIYHNADFSARVKSHFKDSAAVNHDLNLSYYYFGDESGPEFTFGRDHFNVEEHGVKVDGSFSKFYNSELYLLDAGVDFLSNTTGPNDLPSEFAGAEFFDTHTINNAIVHINPKISTHGDFYKIKAGLAIYSQIEDVAEFTFYPDVEAQFSLFNDIFMPYAGLTGGIRRNSVRGFFRENPFISANPGMLQNTNEKLNIYGGIRGTLSSRMSFNAKAAISTLEQAPLFKNRVLFGTSNNFEVVYDDMEVFHLSGEINFQQNEHLMIHLRGEFNNYSTTNEREAWHLPELRGTLSAKYNIADKFILTGEVYAMGTRFAEIFVPEQQTDLVEEIPAFADINFGFEYRYTKRISAFVNANNILNNRYQRWYNFQNFGFNILGGFTYSF